MRNQRREKEVHMRTTENRNTTPEQGATETLTGQGIHPAETGSLLSGAKIQRGPILRSGKTLDQLIRSWSTVVPTLLRVRNHSEWRDHLNFLPSPDRDWGSGSIAPVSPI